MRVCKAASADRNLKQYIEGVKGVYPLNRAEEILLVGIWYQESTLLDYAIPNEEKFVAGKWPKWEIATIAYMLALQEHGKGKWAFRECL